MSNITFRLQNETKGAVRFQEVDAKGQDVEGDDAFVGTLYMRKAKLAKIAPKYASGGTLPEKITVAITVA